MACHLSGALSPAEAEAALDLRKRQLRALIEDYEYQLAELDGEIGRAAAQLKGLKSDRKNKAAELESFRRDLANHD